MTIKYAVYPHKIESKSDGDRHYISAAQLIRLYNVDPKECIIITNERDEARNRDRLEGLIKLYPSYHGNYSIPKNPSPKRGLGDKE